MADLASSPYFLLILFIAAFALPLVYLVWIRNSPRYGREPWPTVLKTFAWGAVFSVIIAIILSVVFILILGQIQSLNDFFARRFQDPTAVMGYGLAKSWLSARPWAVFPFYVVAVAMHATFNLFSTLADGAAQQNNTAGAAVAFLAAVSLAIVAISVVRLKLVTRRSSASR